MFYDRFLLGISDNANIVLKWDVMYINNFKIEYNVHKQFTPLNWNTAYINNPKMESNVNTITILQNKRFEIQCT